MPVDKAEDQGEADPCSDRHPVRGDHRPEPFEEAVSTHGRMKVLMKLLTLLLSLLAVQAQITISPDDLVDPLTYPETPM